MAERYWPANGLGGSVSYDGNVRMWITREGPGSYKARYGTEDLGLFPDLWAAQKACEKRAEQGSPQGSLL